MSHSEIFPIPYKLFTAMCVVAALLVSILAAIPSAYAGQAAESSISLQAASTSLAPADVQSGSTQVADSGQNIYRLYNRYTGEHFYTNNLNEAKQVSGAGWVWEGVGWVAPSSGDDVYRLYNRYAGDHHYTTSAGERDKLKSLGWQYEGVAFKSGGPNAILRQYNPYARTGSHNFTTSSAENQSLVKAGWRGEGGALRALSTQSNSITAFWLVSPWSGGLERYWVASNGYLATSRLITPNEGAGYYAYAKPSGAVVRGSWRSGSGSVYVADNKGQLPDNDGWLVTGAYTGGALQRYYVIRSSHTVRTGQFSVDGKLYWGEQDTGYVLRNWYKRLGNAWYYADNDGVLSPNLPAGMANMINRAQQCASLTGQLIVVDCSNHKVAVFTGSRGNWDLQHVWMCTNGADATPTVKGTYQIGSRGYSFGSGYTCYYWTQIYGGYLFHSVLYRQGTFDVLDGRLGISASHGCVRLDISNARWINEHVASGTSVLIY